MPNTQLVRLTTRGKKAHLPQCRRVSGRSTVEVPWYETARYCTNCCPRCIVCMTDGGRPVRQCPNRHGVCDDCMLAHVDQQGRIGAIPTCPCGEGEQLDIRFVPTIHWRKWMHAIVGNDRKVDTAKEYSLATFSSALCDECLIPRCPYCSYAYSNFDACAALSCPRCNEFFCGLCYQKCPDDRHTHQHVLECKYNPSESYYVSDEIVVKIKNKRGRTYMKSRLKDIRNAHGALFALSVLFSVRTFQPKVFNCVFCMFTSVSILKRHLLILLVCCSLCQISGF